MKEKKLMQINSFKRLSKLEFIAINKYLLLTFIVSGL